MLAFFASAARSLPTSAAWSVFVPLNVFFSWPWLAGGGGGLRGGRWVRYMDKTNNRNSHNNLLVSILNLFGDTRTTYGNPAFCSGPLSNIT